MRYLLAILLPPIAVLICGKPFQAVINLLFCLLAIVSLFIFPLCFPLLALCIIHALFIAHNYYADERNKELIAAMRGQ